MNTTKRPACQGTGRTDGIRISQWTGYKTCPVCGKPVAPDHKSGGLRYHTPRKGN